MVSLTYSDYKGHCTVKFLGGTDNIGCPHAANIPPGSTGRYTDSVMTKLSGILRQLTFAGAYKVDKGFLVNNEAVAKGVVIDRSQKAFVTKYSNYP